MDEMVIAEIVTIRSSSIQGENTDLKSCKSLKEKKKKQTPNQRFIRWSNSQDKGSLHSKGSGHLTGAFWARMGSLGVLLVPSVLLLSLIVFIYCVC